MSAEGARASQREGEERATRSVPPNVESCLLSLYRTSSDSCSLLSVLVIESVMMFDVVAGRLQLPCRSGRRALSPARAYSSRAQDS